MKVKEESEKVVLKLNIQKTKIMAFSPITSWQIDGETMETMRDFILGGAPKLLQMVTPILGPPDVKNWLIWKDPDAGKDWMQEEKGMTEDEVVGWHHQLNRHEFEQAPCVGDAQGSLAGCSP